MIIKTSRGVEFEVFKPSVLAIRAVEKQMNAKKPKPPEIFLEDKDRTEPNESDPDFINAMNEWTADLAERQYNVALITGTRISSVPEDVEDFNNDSWHGSLFAMGLELGNSQQERYLQWVKYISAPIPEDMAILLNSVLSQLGVPEEDVAEAIEAFRSKQERNADNRLAVVGNSQNGD